MTNDGPLESQQPAFEPDPRKFAAAQFQRANLTLPELWTYYYGIGGSADELVLDAYLNEIVELPPLQVDLLHTAIREITADGT
ncbi:hypothetical protein [Pseudarthrobacter sulfonivorans]|uniref:hypothetical protein n=1 Tax=Pseudarthrobacter sulfonivorans TaxID=121292 RepID=UPI00286350BB|nr:hypothetical protein [Pseudarthrobacter sulfonivorans]MDR6414625.1 hypothetical protein [Pseudarthrobacter sulfonivorans]